MPIINPDPTPLVTLRRLFTVMAGYYQQNYTFKTIADEFYTYGIIGSPEDPWNGGYEGNKYDYALERLSKATDIEAFLRNVVPEAVFNMTVLGYGGDDSTLKFLMKKMGYVATEPTEEFPAEEYEAPEDLDRYLPVGQVASITKSRTTLRVNVMHVSGELKRVIDELNDNAERQNYNAVALLARRTITLGVYVAMRKKGKNELLRDPNGDDKELSQVLEAAKQELKIPAQIMARLRSTKWLADSANHSYAISINQNDAEYILTATRLLIDEIFSDETRT